MTSNFVPQLNRGPGYPELDIASETGYELMQRSLTKRVGCEGPIVIINVRKYGLEEDAAGILKAAELLHKLGNYIRLSNSIGGVFITMNPKTGCDTKTRNAFQKAWEGANTTLTATFNQRAPVCVLHVRQPEGSPNSWTAGLSAPAALAMHMVRRSEWHRTWIWNLSGEVEIDFAELAKAEELLKKGIRPLTFRKSPEWLHPAMAAFKDDRFVFKKAFDWVLRQFTSQKPLVLNEVPEEIFWLTPLIRNTCLWVPLSDLNEVGLWDLRCNERQGMEDWLLTLHRMVTFSNLYPREDSQDVVHYPDSRFLTTDPEEQAKERRKFEDECVTLTRHFNAFFGTRIFERSIPSKYQEFHMP